MHADGPMAFPALSDRKPRDLPEIVHYGPAPERPRTFGQSVDSFLVGCAAVILSAPLNLTTIQRARTLEFNTMDFQPSRRTDRITYLAAAALFLSFLIYSAPHQVHHAFQPRHAAPCAAYLIAKSCHLQPATAVDFSFVRTVGEWIAPAVAFPPPHLRSASVSQRAPPSA